MKTNAYYFHVPSQYYLSEVTAVLRRDVGPWRRGLDVAARLLEQRENADDDLFEVTQVNRLGLYVGCEWTRVLRSDLNFPRYSRPLNNLIDSTDEESARA